MSEIESNRGWRGTKNSKYSKRRAKKGFMSSLPMAIIVMALIGCTLLLVLEDFESSKKAKL